MDKKRLATIALAGVMAVGTLLPAAGCKNTKTETKSVTRTTTRSTVKTPVIRSTAPITTASPLVKRTPKAPVPVTPKVYPYVTATPGAPVVPSVPIAPINPATGVKPLPAGTKTPKLPNKYGNLTVAD